MQRYSQFIFAIFILAILVYPLLKGVITFQIAVWDEARYAVNAIEMMHSRNPLVVTFDGQPDWWNSKPPMAVWLQAISMKTLGINEIALRLPSVLATIGCFLLLLFFTKRIANSYFPGLVAALALASSLGMIRRHVALTADVDALFTFFILAYSLSFLSLLLLNPEKKNSYWAVFSITLTCAFLCKGIAAFIPLPGLVIVTLLSKKTKALLTTRQFYFSILVIVVVFFGYYLVREQFDNGYIKAVLRGEIGFYANGGYNKNRPFLFYFNNITNEYFYPLAATMPICFVLGFFTKNKIINRAIFFTFIFCLTFILIHSFSKNGNEWYDAPVYPFLCLVFGFAVYILFFELAAPLFNKVTPRLRTIIIGIFVTGILYYPYSKVLTHINENKNIIYHLEREGAFMRHLNKIKFPIKDYTVCMKGGVVDPVKFYKESLNRHSGYSIKITNTLDFKPGQVVLVGQTDNIFHIIDHYDCNIIKAWDNSRLFKINSIKKDAKQTLYY
ncbi:MAG: glycosyltransferase family 39 protein [Bacteroidales bacterium]